MAEFPLILKGARIELRTLEPTFENAKMIFDVVVANRDYLLQWLPWASTEITGKPEDSFDFLLKMQRNRKDNIEYGFGIFLDNKYIGNISIFDVSEKRKSGEIGYWLVKDAMGKGYMTEAVKLIENAFFESFGNRIQIKCDTRNIPSQNVPKRLNYHLDGEIRQDNTDTSGKFRNTLIFSKLKSEWEK
ncbi:MAG: GNAT family N-acetyltransferase [Alphaproteobacteria bacterium]|nr:GNAT family N-acetyltransferase [Alphaproteobacteria bacterium]